ncbi:MAG: alanine:cation symporter family protein [Melioribacteraceae bacterium]|nr:alanine:cation symporter family protein [Melioribacteraceae bacterium]MCF8265601.1 alanine:cation symporter family protein [Melioribacteraceae bacterium]MCF8413490.1 alanine:cation symporter family protein [Melioribacteraceae bacterium]MCF8431556.1 alanine:cation symporter family protein [Melioribacteraceae bacterium]
MKKSVVGLITLVVIFVVLIIGGIPFFDAVWSFPGNFDFIKNIPSEDLPLGSIPFMILALLGTGIFISFKLFFPQLRNFWHGVKVTAGIYDDPDDEGDLTHFKALATALSATVGIGNIAGVATAIYYGGPGALFWMWVTAFFGTALKFSECTLAHKYRDILPDGSTAGGPMYTIEKGLGQNWRWLAVAFASFAVLCSFATGNAIQAFTVSDQLYSEVIQLVGADATFTFKHHIFSGFDLSITQVLLGLGLSAIVALVIIGGIKRIGNVTGLLSPVMAVFYVLAAFLILLSNIPAILPSFGLIIDMAFNPPAEIAGVGGGTFLVFMNTALWGIKRGLYSNEAGQGSAAIAHSTAKTKHSVREGTVAMLEPFIDTITICTLTGLVIITTGAWHHTEFYVNRIDPSFNSLDLNASLLTSFAFKEGLSWLFDYGDKIITIGVLLFAISTMISWSFYGDRAAHYLFGEKAIPIYKWFFVLFVFIGAIAELEAVWAFGDAALGFMTFPNLISIVLLSGVLKSDLKKYFSEIHIPFKERGK